MPQSEKAQPKLHKRFQTNLFLSEIPENFHKFIVSAGRFSAEERLMENLNQKLFMFKNNKFGGNKYI